MQSIQDWKASGHYFNYGPFDHQVFYKEIGAATASVEKTLLILHGFPESSYSFHKVVDGLGAKYERIILFDLLGYGLSDKPTTGYTYSLMEQADVALAVWSQLGIQGGHLLSHDMGDSVATELVARHVQGILPGWFDAGFQSCTFTNGSMVLGLADLRITQKLLLSKYGKFFNKLTKYPMFRQQVRSAHGNDRLSDQDVQDLWELNSYNEGHRKTYLTIKYLNDRRRWEKTRWLPALTACDLPVRLRWGDADAVARIEMAHYLKDKICPQADLKVMPGLGHFCQLGSPEEWVQHVIG